MSHFLPNQVRINPFKGELSDHEFETQFARNICFGVLDEKAIIGISDAQGRIVYANKAFLNISGYTRPELLGRSFSILNSGHHGKHFFHNMWKTITKGKIWRGDICNKSKHGNEYWVDTTIVPIVGARANVIGYASIRLDITARKKAASELLAKTNLLQGMKDSFPGGVAIINEHKELIDFNDTFLSLLKIPPDLLRPGHPLAMDRLLRFHAERGDFGPGSVEAHVEKRMCATFVRSIVVYEHEMIEGHTIEIRSAPLPKGGWVRTYVDVSDRRDAQRKVEFLAEHDALTSLANRRSLRRRTAEFKAEAESCNSGFALLLIDLDRFKQINDNHGHPTGDKILSAVALRLTSACRSSDVVARIGGDEFAILLRQVRNIDEVRAFAERLIKVLSAPYPMASQTHVIGASVGGALFPSHGRSVDQLFKKADMALYHAKAGGRGQFQAFDSLLQIRLSRRLVRERELRAAIESRQFELHYQPQIDLATSATLCLEALVRWRHPTRGLIYPASFIDLAEETGLIEALGGWVLREACEAAQVIPSEIKMAVNVSPRQVQNGKLLKDVKDALLHSSLSPPRLELEITENAILKADGETVGTCNELRELGVSLAMDDFGAGYSSMTVLHELPFNKIKIDRRFISTAESCARSSAFVSAIVSLAKAFRMEVTAEGIETEAQMQFAKSRGCRYGQGYLFARPRPLEEVLRCLQAAKDNEPTMLRRVHS